MMLCRGNLLKSKKERFVDAENVEQWKNFNIMGDLIGSEERKSKLKWLGPIDKIHKYFKNNAICNPTIKDVEEAYLNPMLLSNYARNKIKEKELPDMQALCLAMYFRGINRRDKFGRFECSFDDMVFWPVYNKWKLPEYEYILIDEVQDYNPVQIEVISNFAKAGSRVVAVGDRQQAIYGWRGAIKAMDKLKERLEE
jgi:superfamily I DNA/RNA helicase